MKLLFFCPHWGSEDLPLEVFFQRVKEAGYDGVEMNISFDPAAGKELRLLLETFDLKLIAQQYLEPKIETPEAYGARMEDYLRHLAGFEPLLINSHTGRDHFSFEANCRLIEQVKQISQETGVPILHETHRGRFSFSAHGTRPFLERYPDLMITADFSHWVNVAESYLEDQAESVSLAMERSAYIHARVGHMEGPQVPHPAAPEWQETLDYHLAWWDQIVALQQERNREWLGITPEFGPLPYLPSLPFTHQPVASQWEINRHMMELLKKHYAVG